MNRPPSGSKPTPETDACFAKLPLPVPQALLEIRHNPGLQDAEAGYSFISAGALLATTPQQ